MRITPNSTAYNALYNIQQSRAKLDSLQEQVASGYNYNRPSDDPVMTNLLLTTNDSLRANEQYQTNITKASTWLNMTNTALQGMSDTVAQAKKLMATIGSGSSDPSVLQSAVSQLTALRQQLADMGNTQLQGQYIFAGAKSSTQPFDRAIQSSPYSGTYYNGDSTVNKVQIDTSATENLNLTGDQVLTGPDVNILQEMDKLITAVGANDVAGIQQGAKNLEKGATQIENAQSTIYARVSRLDSASSMLTTSKNTLETIIGDNQNADYTKLAVQLSLQQTAFEASLSATAKISQMSLLDYL